MGCKLFDDFINISVSEMLLQIRDVQQSSVLVLLLAVPAPRQCVTVCKLFQLGCFV